MIVQKRLVHPVRLGLWLHVLWLVYRDHVPAHSQRQPDLSVYQATFGQVLADFLTTGRAGVGANGTHVLLGVAGEWW